MPELKNARGRRCQGGEEQDCILQSKYDGGFGP
jgi:hypothetical protein